MYFSAKNPYKRASIMSLLRTNYTIEIDKGVDSTRALFDSYFKDMAKAGYSMRTVILNPSYGRKKFSGTVNEDGVYNARLIASQETDEIYRNSPVNRIQFFGNDNHTTVNVSVETAKYTVVFVLMFLVSLIIFCVVTMYAVTSGYSLVIPIAVLAVLTALSFIPLFVAKHHVNEAKCELLYILKYSDKK